MKLHLPKALFTAVMAVFAVSQTVWAGSWDGDTYTFTGTDDANIIDGTVDDHTGSNGMSLRAGADGVTATVTEVKQQAGSKLFITGTYDSTSNYFESLTINNLVIGDGTGSGDLEIGTSLANEAGTTDSNVTIHSMTGTLTTLVVGAAGNLTLGNGTDAATFTVSNGVNAAEYGSAITIAKNAVLDLSSITMDDGTVAQNKKMTYLMNAATGAGQIKLKSGSYIQTENTRNTVALSTNYVVDGGAGAFLALTAYSNGANGGTWRNWVVTKDGSITVGNGAGELNIRAGQQLMIENGGSVHVGTLSLGHETAGHPGSVTMSGSDAQLTVATIKGKAGKHNSWNNEVSILGGTLTVTGENALSIDSGSMLTATIGDRGDSSVVLKTAENNVSFDGSALGEGGSLTIGNVKIDKDNAKMITISNATLSGTITNEATATDAGLTLSGAITVDSAITSLAKSNGYTYDEVVGFDCLKGTGNYSFADNVTFNGINFSAFTVSDGVYAYTVEADKTGTIYHVVSGTTTIDDTNKGPSKTHTGFDVYKDAVLEVNGISGINQLAVYLRDGAKLSNTVGDCGIDGTGLNQQQFKYIYLSGDATVHAGKRMSLVGNSYNQATLDLAGHKLTKTGSALFTVANADISAGIIDVQAGTFQIADKSKGDAELNISQDLVVNVESGATFKWYSDETLNNNALDAHLGNFLLNSTGSGNIEIDLAGNSYVLIEGAAGGGVLTNKSDFAGTLKMSNDTQLVLGQYKADNEQYTQDSWAVNFGQATIELNGGGLRFNGSNSTIGTLKVLAEDTLHVQDAKNKADAGIVALTIGSLQLDAKINITKQHKGLVQINKLTGNGDFYLNAGQDFAVNIVGLENYTGQITNNDANGKLMLGADGSTMNIARTIVNNGTLTLADGAILNVADVAVFNGGNGITTGLVDATGTDTTATGNGFVGGFATLQVISGTGSHNISSVMYNEQQYTLTNGAFTTVMEMTSDYVLKGTGDYANATMSDIVNQATQAGKTLSSVTLGNGNKLTVDAAPTTSFKIEAGENGTSTLDIAQDQTVSSADVTITSGAMQFTGKGTYTMLGGLKGTAADDWTGTVYLEAKDDSSGGTAVHDVSSLDLTQYGNSKSTIVLKGVKGSLKDGTVDANLKFENTLPNGSWAAVEITGGTNSDTYTFTGTLSGGGNVVINRQNSNGMNFVFTGDVKDFTGELKNNTGTNTYTFKDKATAVNAGIIAGGTMNLNTENTADTTFKTVTVAGTAKLNLENKGTGKLQVDSLNTQNGAQVAVTASSGNIEITGKANTNMTLASVDVAANKNVTLNGNVTVTNTLTIDSTNALTVQGALVLTGATIDLSGFTVDTTLANMPTSFTLGTATGGITRDEKISFTGLTVEGYNIDITTMPVTSESGIAMAAEGDTTALVLTLTANQPAEPPLDKLTINDGSYDATSGVLTFATDKAVTDNLASTIEVTMSDEVWNGILEKYTTLPDTVLVSFQGKDSEQLFDFNGDGTAQVPTITINGEGVTGDLVVRGDGTIVGKYVTAYIPEPTSTTLSLLALAGLAVRRRRK